MVHLPSSEMVHVPSSEMVHIPSSEMVHLPSSEMVHEWVHGTTAVSYDKEGWCRCEIPLIIPCERGLLDHALSNNDSS